MADTFQQKVRCECRKKRNCKGMALTEQLVNSYRPLLKFYRRLQEKRPGSAAGSSNVQSPALAQ